MRARHRLSRLLLRHGIRFDDGTAWTQRHRDWLATITLPWPAAQATMLDAIGAIDVLTHRRDALEREITVLLPASPWATDGRAAALPARHRHPDRGRPVLRDRRLRTLRAPRTAHELPRARPLRAHQRPQRAAKARSPRPAPVTPAACSSRPPGNTAPDPASAKPSPTAKPANPPKRSRSPTAPNNACTAPGNDSNDAANDAPSSPSPSPANWPASAGPSPAPNNPTTTTPSRRLGRWRPGNARGTRDVAMSNPPHTGAGHARSSRQRIPTTKPRSCGPNPRISA